jgi:hypothetical protein
MSAIILNQRFDNPNLPSNAPIDTQLLAMPELASWFQFDPLYATYGTPPAISQLANRKGDGEFLGQGTGANRPNLNATMNGFPAADFDGSSDRLDHSDTPDLSGAFTFVVLFSPDTIGVTQNVIGSWTGSNDGHILNQQSAALKWQVGNGEISAATLIAGETYLAIGSTDDAGVVHSRVYMVSSSQQPVAASGVTDNVWTTAQLTVGALNPAGGQPFNGKISEVMIWTIDLLDAANADTLDLVESFFRQVYGVKTI